MKKKPKNLTKAQIKALIKQIARATYDPMWGERFSNLLSAMRGPDNNDVQLKENTTCVIRGALNWRCGIMNEPPITYLGWREVLNAKGATQADEHFKIHITQAVETMRDLGLIP